MPYSPLLRIEQQVAGTNLSTWGDPKLNNALGRLEFAIAGWTTIALTGNYTLTSSNGDDESRSAMLKFTGGGPWTVTTNALSKTYVVWNATTDDMIVTTGAGNTATLAIGEMCTIACDGSDWSKVKVSNYNGDRLSGLGDPTLAQDAATKAYVDAQAFNTVNLPGQTGNAGAFLKTNGSAASWTMIQGSDVANLTVTQITDYAADQTTRADALRDEALVFALIF